MIASGPTNTLNFSQIGVRVCELEQFFKYANKKTKKKMEKKHKCLLTHILKKVYALLFKFGM